MSKLRTFDEWNELGYRIQKGSKAIKISPKRGALFSKDQVYKPTKRYYNYDHDERYFDWLQEDYDYDEPMLYDTWMFN